MSNRRFANAGSRYCKPEGAPSGVFQSGITLRGEKHLPSTLAVRPSVGRPTDDGGYPDIKVFAETIGIDPGVAAKAIRLTMP